tara:strand:+ start:1153 stop:1335 length:183 start_codon:yes stop_codon:yes gene_type:complete
MIYYIVGGFGVCGCLYQFGKWSVRYRINQNIKQLMLMNDETNEAIKELIDEHYAQLNKFK